MSFHPLTAEQAAAVSTRDRDVFLNAGAGTGKTTVLVERFCDAVCEDGVEVGSILAFTFTDEAAAQLKRRIRAELARRGATDHAREAEGAWISTIHGFCQRLLATHPLAVGLDPRFRVIDESEAGRLAAQAFDLALEDFLAGEDPERTLLVATYQPWGLRRLVQAAHDELRGHGHDEPALPPLDGSSEYESLRELLSTYGRRYAEAKRERSGLDFEDLQLMARRLLRDRPAICDRYRARFRHLMVDEFQDTNELQLSLVDELRGPDTRLLTVGDRFQSIYGFRHADLAVFERRREEAARAPDAQAVALDLLGNFRSRPEVLDAVNVIGRTLLDGFGDLAATRPPGELYPEPVVELLATERDGWDEVANPAVSVDERAQPHRLAEARFLAQRLGELWRTGTPRGDMVLLLRSFTYVEAFEEALRDTGLDPYVVGGRGYWSQQQVADVRALLGALANPRDDLALLGALASPFCSTSPDALWLLRRAAGESRPIWTALRRLAGNGGGRAEDGGGEEEADLAHRLTSIPAEDRERLGAFVERFRELRERAPMLGLEALIDRAIATFGYDLATLAMPAGERRLANVRKLMRQAREYEAREGRDLRGFLEWVEFESGGGAREGHAPLGAEGHDGVRVMTIHAAKGLEFPVVAVADLGRRLWFDHPPVRVHPGDSTRVGLRLARLGERNVKAYDYDALSEEAHEAEAAEEHRLVYVAATRAKDRLVLSGAYDLADPPDPDALRRSSPILDRLFPALGEVAAIRVNQPPPPGEALQLFDTAPAPGANGAGETPEADPLEPLPAPLLTPASAETPTARYVSYSALADYDRCSYRFYAERALGMRPEGELPGEGEVDPADPHGPRGRIQGRVVHALLEWSALNDWSRPAAEQAAELLRQEGVRPDRRATGDALDLVAAWLDSPLCAELRAQASSIRPEVPFLFPLAGLMVRGEIDLLAQLPGGELALVDYKTDRLTAGPEAEMSHYTTQRRIYAYATLAGAPRVRTAYVFLERPDQPVLHTYEAGDLATLRAEIEALAAGLLAHRFTPTEAPHRELCLDCPARRRLCRHGPDRTLAAGSR